MSAAIDGVVDHPQFKWELESRDNNLNKVFDSEDLEAYCATNIPDNRLQLAMNYVQVCGIIETGRYQDTVQAARKQGMKEHLDFYISSPSSNLTMSQMDRFELRIEHRREHLMTLLVQAREQKMVKEQHQR